MRVALWEILSVVYIQPTEAAEPDLQPLAVAVFCPDWLLLYVRKVMGSISPFAFSLLTAYMSRQGPLLYSLCDFLTCFASLPLLYMDQVRNSESKCAGVNRLSTLCITYRQYSLGNVVGFVLSARNVKAVSDWKAPAGNIGRIFTDIRLLMSNC